MPSFSNPLTGSSYRLRVGGAAWRITKSVLASAPDGGVVLRHLRGLVGEVGAAPLSEAVAQLVRGEHQATDRDGQGGAPILADPAVAFAEVVLLDIDRTASVLTGMASEARQRTGTGSRGFRVGCSVLRRQERQALEMAVGGCRRLADVWVASGLNSPPCGLPAWLSGALEDGLSPADHGHTTGG